MRKNPKRRGQWNSERLTSQDKEENGGAVVNMVYIALGAVLLLLGVFAFMLYRRTYSTGQES